MELFVDSCDHYNTAQIATKWSTEYTNTYGMGGVVGAWGRRGTNGIRFVTEGSAVTATGGSAGGVPVLGQTTSLGISFESNDSLIGYQFAFKAQGAGSFNNIGDYLGNAVPGGVGAIYPGSRAMIGMLRWATYVQLVLMLENDGSITVLRGGSNILLNSTHTRLQNTAEEGGRTLRPGVQYHIAFQTLLSTSGAGNYELRVNGDTWLSHTGVQTTHDNALGNGVTILPYATELVVGSMNGLAQAWDYDDFLIWDGDDSDPTRPIVSFPGNLHFGYCPPIMNGDVIEWTPSGSGTNYTKVDDNPHDDDTTVNTASGGTPIDVFRVDPSALIEDGEIVTMQVVHSARSLDDGGDPATASALHVGGTTYTRDGVGTAQEYMFTRGLWGRSPASGNAVITYDDFVDNTASGFQPGYKKTR